MYKRAVGLFYGQIQMADQFCTLWTCNIALLTLHIGMCLHAYMLPLVLMMMTV